MTHDYVAPWLALVIIVLALSVSTVRGWLNRRRHDVPASDQELLEWARTLRRHNQTRRCHGRAYEPPRGDQPWG